MYFVSFNHLAAPLFSFVFDTICRYGSTGLPHVIMLAKGEVQFHALTHFEF